MKIIAILLLILGCLLIVGMGFMYLFLFAFSFDAPGSDSDPKAWLYRSLFFLPVIGLIIALVLALTAFMSGNYARSANIGSLFGLALIAILILLAKTQADNNRILRQMQAQEIEDAKYPIQTFLRPTEHGADTIIVFPSRVVAYRVFTKTFNKTIGGPIGELNKTRDTIQLEKNPEDFLKREEYEQFFNSDGKKFTEVFQFKN
jgi:hypothetical protein